ncbi:MAG: hypothetical protein K0S12_690 [Bacteroidetes bacterium]|jgi:hypothetical protein|nr:hypothetical protein [Bacteroidota bacterium]
MKKSIALVALAFGVSSAFAQDLTSKKGEPMLPEAGDWGVAIDATPFLTYAGHFFGKTSNPATPSWNFFTNSQTITGKYFQDASTAYRGSLRIGLQSASTRSMVTDRAQATNTTVTFPTADPMVENVWKRSNTTIGLAAGIEKRKGKTRLQGFYGGEAGIYMAMQKDKYTYGNALTPTSGTVIGVGVTSADDFGTGNYNSAAPIQGINGDARATEVKAGTVFSFGVRGFIGAEYFILPKMSLGGEFGWGLGISSTGKSRTTWESRGTSNAPGSTQTTGTTEIEGAKNGGFWLDTDNKNSVWGPTGSLRLALHF